MAGSAHNAGPRDEQGKLIRFPRSKWVPEDGVEPLTGEHSDAVESTTATVEGPAPELEAFEADDFWASGDTQQFVGTGGSSAPVATPVADGVDEQPVIVEPALAAAACGGGTPAIGWRRQLRIPLPTTWVAAGLVLAALVATGVLIAALASGTSHTLARHAPASLARPIQPTKPWVVYSARPHPAKRHMTPAHRAKPAAPASSGTSTSGGASSSSQAGGSSPVQAQPVYHSSPPASVAGASGSSSGGGGGSSSSNQNAGPTSALGPGTSPSG